MASAERRRRAGAAGVFDEDEVLRAAPAKAPKAPNSGPQEQAEILRGKQLEYACEGGRRLFVPTEFTIGDMIHKRAMEDLHAFAYLVVTEVQMISSLDLASQPERIFAKENEPYLLVTLLASNVRDFLRRIVLKVAWVINDKGDRERATAADFDGLDDAAAFEIAARLLSRWVEGLASKNRQRTAQG